MAERCPTCGGAVHRSRAKHLYHRLRKVWSATRLFRCSGCGWRGWLLPVTDMRVAELGAPEAAPPDLSDLDNR